MYDLLLTALGKNKENELLVSDPVDQPMGVELFYSASRDYEQTAFSPCTQSEIEQLLIAFFKWDMTDGFTDHKRLYEKLHDRL